ncbi:ribonuclease D [Kushneria pakistanensis]|uniref:Ribonuclease D n=1 Tax=Kushneria pakistanensis TaxID=1508770 RepID=A0ABQ3FN37_9GAMM|nr:ribonuclease D [Kushneria pakistanensis]GHC31191.1 ribonuclease D [Kushneria pakistanensis]
MPTDVTWHFIDTEEALERACADLATREVIGVDTEFMRETTFYPVPALIQLGDAEVVYLIDPTVVAPTASLRTLLGDEGPLKILHACGEDMEIFMHWTGDVPSPIVDTQLAHALLGEESSISYQRLVDHWEQQHVPKGETRSNWLQRPLSEEQCRYAALDVVWLSSIWQRQQIPLREQGRLAWLLEDCHALVEAARGVRDDERWYLRHRNAWRLEPRQLAAFQRLCVWRERAVRERNLPRNWLASDAILMEIAAALPGNRYELSRIDGIKPSLIKREGDTLLALIQEAMMLDESVLPTVLPSPVSDAYKKRMKALKAAVSDRARELSLPSEVLVTRRELERWISADLQHTDWPSLSGWRGDVLNDALASALSKNERAPVSAPDKR